MLLRHSTRCPANRVMRFMTLRWTSVATGIVAFVGFFILGLSVANDSVHGSCGHYVFTQLEWQRHQADQAALNSLLNGSMPTPRPCHGPGCRQNQLPTTTVIPAPVKSDPLEQYAVPVAANQIELTDCDREFPAVQTVSLTELSTRTFRPPRV
jgi:hypothetical protein